MLPGRAREFFALVGAVLTPERSDGGFSQSHAMHSLIYFTSIPSPLDEITLAATSAGLCGLYFREHRYRPADFPTWQRDDGARFAPARAWLRHYFAGTPLPDLPALAFPGGTEFQQRVWRALQSIPAGETRTYSELAAAVGAARAVRAVGAAIGRNPISIFVPCHRVVGRDGSLTGFAGGIERKRWLLTQEGAVRQGSAARPVRELAGDRSPATRSYSVRKTSASG